ncbi:hypothetical protein AGMMS50262_04760 [Bacteroidia bacterium]|nr:hypothetical protein AGMMS50262_04760 [Bacteroidia bacterium]
MKRYILLLLILGLTGALSAQVIRLDFRHFAGKEYTFSLVKGNQNDTILTGTLDKNGQAVLVVPKTTSGYAGTGVFRLTEGGGLDFILNQEKAFLIRCTEAQPNDKNIFYIGSQENNFLSKSYLSQEEVLGRYDVIRPALEVYGKNDSLYGVFEKEKWRLEASYNVLQNNLEESKLYAAFLRRIHNFLRGIPDRLGESGKDNAANSLDFITQKMNLNWLYTSNTWNHFWDEWLNREMELKDDNRLFLDTKTILSRTPEGEIRNALLDRIYSLYTRYGKDSLLYELGMDQLIGKPAPALQNGEKRLVPKKALVIFYESGCNNCENELLRLRGLYPLLKEKGYDVISIAADTSEEVFNRTASQFPWTAKQCDFQGFDGVNFRNYQVVGTPMLFVTDKEGKITGRYATVEELMEN